MLKSGIINPGLLDLLARIRHTNTLVICDWAFPFWPELETVDISLTRGIPGVLDVFNLIRPNFEIGEVWQAEEFLEHHEQARLDDYAAAFEGLKVTQEPHVEFKKRVPQAIGVIRTGDDTMYGNIILESA
jgi:D-ribose pyranase